ncbi:MAG TPA: rod shape-determining protein MreC, partial [Eggerthellaceae bacterium]|nr:rod shape-determining protein MreC [Eggerthellaceae bacterium]
MPLNTQQSGSPVVRRIVLVVLLVASVALATVYGREGESGPIHAVQNAVMGVTGGVGSVSAGVGVATAGVGDLAANATANDQT